MGFQDFLANHIIIDYFWEIFKCVSPTLIALMTIAINVRINKRKESRESKEREIKELQKKIAEIIPHVVRNGADILQAIQNAADSECSGAYLDKYEEDNIQLLTLAREYQVYENIRMGKSTKTSLFEYNVLTVLTQFAYELEDILSWYNSECTNTDLSHFDDLCEKVKEKCMVAERKTEELLTEYCKWLGKQL